MGFLGWGNCRFYGESGGGVGSDLALPNSGINTASYSDFFSSLQLFFSIQQVSTMLGLHKPENVAGSAIPAILMGYVSGTASYRQE